MPPSIAAAAIHGPYALSERTVPLLMSSCTISPALETRRMPSAHAIAYAHSDTELLEEDVGAAHIARTGDVICSECSSVPSGALHAWTTLPAAAT